MDLPDFNTAACRGASGGATTSKYVGLIGQNPSGNTTILLPPWYGEGSIGTLCNGATSGVACNGGAGEMFNIAWNGLGNSSRLALTTCSKLRTIHRGRMFTHGGLRPATSLIRIALSSIRANMLESILLWTAAEASHVRRTAQQLSTYSALNVTPEEHLRLSLMINTTQQTVCTNCVFTMAASGIGVQVANGATYYDIGGYVVQTGTVGGCYYAPGTGVIHLDGSYCISTAGAASTAITMSGAGVATATKSVLSGGATSGIWNCAASSKCVDGGLNIYGTTPIQAGAGSLTGISASQTGCAVNSVSPAACGSAASGAVVVPTTTATYTDSIRRL